MPTFKINQERQSIDLPLEHKKLEVGFIGRVIGTGDSAANSIVFLLSLGLMVSIFVVLLIDMSMALEWAKTIVAAITGLIGFVAGRFRSSGH